MDLDSDAGLRRALTILTWRQEPPRPPAMADALARAERGLGVALPATLRRLLSLADGFQTVTGGRVLAVDAGEPIEGNLLDTVATLRESTADDDPARALVPFLELEGLGEHVAFHRTRPELFRLVWGGDAEVLQPSFPAWLGAELREATAAHLSSLVTTPGDVLDGLRRADLAVVEGVCRVVGALFAGRIPDDEALPRVRALLHGAAG